MRNFINNIEYLTAVTAITGILAILFLIYFATAMTPAYNRQVARQPGAQNQPTTNERIKNNEESNYSFNEKG